MRSDRDAIEEQKQRAEGNTAALRFESMLTQLGDFPDKNIIDQLTLTAKAVMQLLGAAGAKRVVENLTRTMLHVSTAPARLIPLFYLLDSILKNVGRAYVTLCEPEIVALFRQAFERSSGKDRFRLNHLRLSWVDRALFAPQTAAFEAICQPVLDQARDLGLQRRNPRADLGRLQ